jgi:hypothetical protein
MKQSATLQPHQPHISHLVLIALRDYTKPGMMAQICHPSTQKVESGGSEV